VSHAAGVKQVLRRLASMTLVRLLLPDSYPFHGAIPNASALRGQRGRDAPPPVLLYISSLVCHTSKRHLLCTRSLTRGRCKQQLRISLCLMHLAVS